MTGRVILLGSAFAFSVALLTSASVYAVPQTNDQQKCINKMNKDAIKLQASQGKEQSECVKRETNDEAGTDVDACIVADPRLKVSKRQDKTTADDDKCCGGSGLPGFGYTGDTTINVAARQAEVDMFHDIFGNPSDPNLYDCNPFVGECQCQRNVADRIEKLFATLGRTWVKCKKSALKVDKEPFPLGAASGADLQVCVEAGTVAASVSNDPGGKIADRSQNILDSITLQACNGTGNDSFGGPACNRTALGGAPTDVELRDCLQNRVECRFCLMVNAIDNLAIDCSAFSGVTCP